MIDAALTRTSKPWSKCAGSGPTGGDDTSSASSSEVSSGEVSPVGLTARGIFDGARRAVLTVGESVRRLGGEGLFTPKTSKALAGVSKLSIPPPQPVRPPKEEFAHDVATEAVLGGMAEALEEEVRQKESQANAAAARLKAAEAALRAAERLMKQQAQRKAARAEQELREQMLRAQQAAAAHDMLARMEQSAISLQAGTLPISAAARPNPAVIPLGELEA
uniref:Uncharacterized protein n=1 Tax=Haptolina ericina TaxID=156174 RepID=A0A7S3AGG9_9EUKA